MMRSMNTENTAQRTIAELEAYLVELDRQEARLPRNGSQDTERKLASIARNRARTHASIGRVLARQVSR